MKASEACNAVLAVKVVRIGVSTLTAALRRCPSSAPSTALLFLSPNRNVWVLVVRFSGPRGVYSDAHEEDMEALTIVLSIFLFITMLWQYWLNSGFIDAPANVAEARKILIEKIKADPAAFVGRLIPTEPSCRSLADVFKKVMTG